jgi:hypothetical protein
VGRGIGLVLTVKKEPGRTPLAFFFMRSTSSVSEDEEDGDLDRGGRIGDGKESDSSLSEGTEITVLAGGLPGEAGESMFGEGISGVNRGGREGE